MESCNRRDLLRVAAVAGASRMASSLQAQTPPKMPRLGVVASVGQGQTPDSAIARVRKLGFPTCQIGFQDLSLNMAGPLKEALKKHQVEATAVMELGPGRMVWDFKEGPLTIGLVPRATRRARMDAMKLAADLANACGIPALQSHCGFIPENMNDPVYRELVEAVGEVATHCKQRGCMLMFETGQETPVTLLRTIHDVGLDNLGVNLDTANLILYGKGNPVDAIDVIGKYVHGMHAKDGRFPTDPMRLGEETPIGKGKVDFATVFRKLKALGYHDAVTIEREIEGPNQTKDILASKAYLEKLIADIYKA